MQVSPHGAIEIENERNGYKFKINGHRLKLYLEGPLGVMDLVDFVEP